MKKGYNPEGVEFILQTIIRTKQSRPKNQKMKGLRRNDVERFDFAGTKMVLRNPDFSG